MNIGNSNKINNPSFKSLMTNKYVLNGLEKIADHGTTFVAATSFIMASGVRPAAIALTPKTDKENKQYAITNSIASGLIKFGMTEAIALPVENAINKIDKAPEKFLKQDTLKTLKGSAKELVSSKSYNIITQTLKLSAGLITAIPKSMLTIALIPLITDLLFNKKKDKKQNIYDNLKTIQSPDIFNNITEKNNRPAFKGGFENEITKGMAKIINNKQIQNFVIKHNFNENNISRNISMLTDVVLTASFVHRTNKSKKIKDERKKPLIYNNVISTLISLTAGYAIDKSVQKNTKNYIDKFMRLNAGNPKLNKYIQGINIARPTLIFAGIYYGILPVFSTFAADKSDKFLNKNKRNN